ncbi:hypothetical protein T11_13590 [Trichinella zimbabwensis]|uniref:Uncharacterized protein n=1 Tax=Trichinella zimbabwensis TaxID=268475 RepID=A0A0V1G862_9BILA|nr:hypothetical protein T11_13590 [Trichinella zimbabwensis]
MNSILFNEMTIFLWNIDIQCIRYDTQLMRN